MVTSSGHGSRHARASKPDARITICRIPASAAARKNSSKSTVRTAMKSTIAPTSARTSASTSPLVIGEAQKAQKMQHQSFTTA